MTERYIIRIETDDEIKNDVENNTLSIAHKNTNHYDYFVKVYGGVKECYKVKEIMKKYGYDDVMGTYDGTKYEFGFNKH